MYDFIIKIKLWKVVGYFPYQYHNLKKKNKDVTLDIILFKYIDYQTF